MFDSFNKKGRKTVAEGFQADGIVKIKEVVNMELPVYGFIVTNGQYGKSVLIAVEVEGNNKLLAVPKRYVDMFEALTDEEVSALMSGEMKLTNIHPFATKNGNLSYSFNLE